MANSINLIYSQEALASIQTVLDGLKATDDEILEITGHVTKLNGALGGIKTPNGLQNFSNDTKKLEAELKTAITRIGQLEGQVSALGATLARTNAAEAAVTTSTNNLGNANALAAAKIEQMAIKMEKANLALRGNVTETEKAALAQRKFANDANLAALSIDRLNSTGASSTKQWNGLGNSINQVSRELPSFMNSMQTGFMAISNNIPIVVDEINKLVAANAAANAAVIASGGAAAATTPVWRALAAAVFSWGTAISIGITLLVAFGPALIEAAFGATKYEQAMKALNDELLKVKSTHTSTAESLREHLNIYKDLSQSESERRMALENINKLIPALTDNELKHGASIKEVEKATNDYIEVLLKRAKWEQLVSNQAKDLAEIDENNLILHNKKLLQEHVTFMDKLGGFYNRQVRGAKVSSEDMATLRLKDRNKILEESLKERRKLLQEDLETTPEKNKGAGASGREPRDKNYDILKKEEHERDVQRLQSSIATNKAIADNEEESLTNRLLYLEKYYKDQDALAEENLNYELYLAKATYDKKKKDLENDKNLTTQSAADRDKALKDMASEYAFEVEKINEKARNQELKNLSEYNKTVTKLNKFDPKEIEIYFNARKAAQEQTFNEEKRILFQQKEDLLKMEGQTNEEKAFTIAMWDHKIEEQARKHAKELLKIELLKNENIILLNQEQDEANRLTPEAIDKLTQKVTALRLEMDKIDASGKESPAVIKLKSLVKGLKDASGELAADMAKDAGFGGLFDAIGKDLDATLPGIQNKFDILRKGVEEGVISSFEAIMTETEFAAETLKDIFSKIDEFDEVRYENRVARLEREKEIAMDYAGQTADGKKSIEDQYETEKRALDRKRAEQKKRAAMFDIAISTAQGIAATFAQLGWPAGIAGAAIVAATGAVQLALVNSKEIPAFAEGGTHTEGGLALVNDGGGNYRETIVTPKGDVIQPTGKNVVMDLPKGSQIYTNKQWRDKQVQNMLGGHEISMGGNYYAGLTSEEMDGILAKHFSDIKTQSVTFDKNGINQWVQNGNARTKKVSMRGSGKGFMV